MCHSGTREHKTELHERNILTPIPYPLHSVSTMPPHGVPNEDGGSGGCRFERVGGGGEVRGGQIDARADAVRANGYSRQGIRKVLFVLCVFV